MAGSNQLPIRRGILEALKADAPFVAEIPKARIFGQTVIANATYPYFRLGSPSAVPLRAACVDGSVTIFAGHVFALPRKEAGAIVETAEDYAARLGALMANALDGAVLALPNGRARVVWTGDQLLQDPSEADCFHHVSNFRVRALTA